MLPSFFCDKHQIDKFKDKYGRNRCKECHKERVAKYRASHKAQLYEATKIWRSNNREKTNAQMRERRRQKPQVYMKDKLMNQYRLTFEQYSIMLEACRQKCEICGKDEIRQRKGVIQRLSVDHCHEAEEKGIMKVRGLLCHNCNIMLGSFKEDINTLKSAIAYLEKHKEQ